MRLLKKKNEALQEYLAVTENFVQNEQVTEVEDLDQFIQSRDRLLFSVQEYDAFLKEELSKLKLSEISDENLKSIRFLDQERLGLLGKIELLDREVVNRVQSLKEGIRLEIQQSEKEKQTIRKFKSHWTENTGKEIDDTL